MRQSRVQARQKEGEEMYYGALAIGRFFNSFYVYYEAAVLYPRKEIIVKSGFKTADEAAKWINESA